jgi:hypothetical protein
MCRLGVSARRETEVCSPADDLGEDINLLKGRTTMTTRRIRHLMFFAAALVGGCGSVAAKHTNDGGTGGSPADAGVEVTLEVNGTNATDANATDTNATDASGAEAKPTGTDASVADAPVADAPVADAPVDHVATCPANMVLIRGGTYIPTGGTSTVFPDYCMDANETTAADFTLCVTNGLCSLANVNVVSDPRCFYGKVGKGTFPMNCLSTIGATEYCQKNGKHLPSEGEWEWAARGGPLGDIFPWGTDVPDVGGLKLCWNMATGTGACETRTHPAGNTPSGIYDMAGNVAEVVSTPFNATAQVAKGGAYLDTVAANVQVVARAAFSNSDANPNVGFRCASTPQ